MLVKQLIFVFLSLLLSTNYVFAFSNCQLKYDSDKRSLPSKRGNCSVCHLNNPSGGGPRTEFGNAFATAGFKITDELVAKFPNLFQQVEPKPSPTTNPTLTGSPAPHIERVKPKIFKVNVQSMLSVMGQNFADGAKAFIDNNEVITSFKSNMLLVINFILNSLGSHELKIQNPDGQESNAAMIIAK